jgi:hypothetical protein
MNNYIPLAISWNDKNKQLTVLSERTLALTARNTLLHHKIKRSKKLPRPLFMPKTNHTSSKAKSI